MQNFGLGIKDSYTRKLVARDTKNFLKREREFMKNKAIQEKLFLAEKKTAAKIDSKLYQKEKEVELGAKLDLIKAENRARRKLNLPLKDVVSGKVLRDKKVKRLSTSQSFTKSLRGIAKSIPVQRQRLPAYDARLRQVQQQQAGRKRKNFFAHADEEEVYGDSGLTFFDGDKRGSDDTGALFGLK